MTAATTKSPWPGLVVQCMGFAVLMRCLWIRGGELPDLTRIPTVVAMVGAWCLVFIGRGMGHYSDFSASHEREKEED